MKLILRRKKQKATPFERATGYLKLGAKGLAAQRLARKSFRRYKFTKKVAPVAGLAAIGAVIAKKARGGAGTPPTTTPTPTSAPSGTSGDATATAAATAATGTSPATDTAPAAAPDLDGALEDAGADGDGPETPKEAAAPGVGDESTSTGDSAPAADTGPAADAPPADASGTEEELGIEGPNQSTPPPPDSVARDS